MRRADSIDFDLLVEYFGDDAVLQLAALRSFLDRSGDLMREIVVGTTQDGVIRSAHNLKSSTRMIGASMLGDLFEELEVEVRAGRGAETTQISRLSFYMESVMSQVRFKVEQMELALAKGALR